MEERTVRFSTNSRSSLAALRRLRIVTCTMAESASILTSAIPEFVIRKPNSALAGWKASLARAIYSATTVSLVDPPLSGRSKLFVSQWLTLDHIVKLSTIANQGTSAGSLIRTTTRCAWRSIRHLMRPGSSGTKKDSQRWPRSRLCTMANTVNLEQPFSNQRTPPNVSLSSRSQNKSRTRLQSKAKPKSPFRNRSNASPTAKPSATTRKTVWHNSHCCANVASEKRTREILDTAQSRTSRCSR